jgi:hypothetical protein
MTNDGGPVNPNEYSMTTESGRSRPVPGYGLTIRDYFAGLAMQGLLADSEVDGSANELAAVAFKFADAMLNERAKQ